MTGAVISRLSAQDAQILRLEAGPIRGHSAKVIVLEPAGQHALPSLAELRAAIAARLDAAPRLRQRLVRSPLPMSRPAWADDPRFDVTRHVELVPVKGPVSRSGLERIVAADGAAAGPVKAALAPRRGARSWTTGRWR